VNVFSVAEFQPQLTKLLALDTSRSLSANEIHFINQWEKFDEELSDTDYLALLQLYINERSTTKVIEVVNLSPQHTRCFLHLFST
jgi:hypothetical protein